MLEQFSDGLKSGFFFVPKDRSDIFSPLLSTVFDFRRHFFHVCCFFELLVASFVIFSSRFSNDLTSSRSLFLEQISFTDDVDEFYGGDFV